MFSFAKIQTKCFRFYFHYPTLSLIHMDLLEEEWIKAFLTFLSKPFSLQDYRHLKLTCIILWQGMFFPQFFSLQEIILADVCNTSVYSFTTSCLKCAAFMSIQVFYNIRQINHQISFSFKLYFILFTWLVYSIVKFRFE